MKITMCPDCDCPADEHRADPEYLHMRCDAGHYHRPMPKLIRWLRRKGWI
jgi:hypothetical protein